MKKWKISILLLSFCLLTGCTVNYNVEIDEQLSVKEKFRVSEVDDFFYNYEGMTHPMVVNTIIEQRMDEINELGYNYITEYHDNGDVTVDFDNHYNTIQAYISKNPIYNQWFKKIEFNETGTIVNLNAREFYPYVEQDPGKYSVTDLMIHIKLPFEVTKHNADQVDKKTNTYSWHITKETKYKQIQFSFDTAKKYEYKIDYAIIIISVAIIVGLGVLVYLFFLQKHKMNNQI